MDDYSMRFKQWMDERGLSPEDIAAAIKKEAGTLKQWRSRGVPSRQSVRAHVDQFMADYDAEKIREFKTLDVLNLQVSPEKLDAWNEAALRSGLIIREWAIQGLDSLAKRENATRKSVTYDFRKSTGDRVAEDEQESNAPEDGEREED
jgi:transcriptional regulator with XRE-family HTH domain